MTLWLFRRKSRRKRARSGTLSGDEAQRPLPRAQTEPEPAAAPVSGKKQSVKRQRVESAKLQRRARTYSFESGRRDSLYVNQKKSNRRTRESAPPLPPSTGANPAASKRAVTNADDEETHTDEGYEPGDSVFERIPTLHATKRDGEHLRQRKSSKRRKNSHDREREAELKAMSNFVPVRPATDAWTSGRPMKRDTRRARTGLGLGFGSGSRGDWDKEHSSEISLPTSGSIHSSMSSGSEQIAYKISAFDAFAPKPTLRYASFPRWGPPSGGSMPQRASSQRRRMSEKEPIPEATLKAHKRIHDLADDLSASDLRELMERDNRRRERKRQKDQEKVDRRLARRAEKQRSAAEKGAPNLERGVIGREVGLGLDPTSAVVTSSKRRETDAVPEQEEAKPQPVADEEPKKLPTPTPHSAFHRTTSIPLEAATTPKKPEEPVSPPVQSPKRRGFLRTKKSRSKSPPQVNRERPQVPEALRKASESGSSRGPSWTSFFRWGNKNKRTSGPSSFSNTSRDSMGTQPQSTATTAPATAMVLPRTVSGGVPRRTLSRFREDLPDFLMSPPDSRAQTPEADPVPPAIAEQDSPPPVPTTDPTHSAQDERYDTPTSGHRSFDADDVRRTPTSWVHREGVGPSPEPQHSMSMASIDSEASWLSGRVGNRSRSSQVRQQRSPHRQPAIGGSDEAVDPQEEGVPEEEIGDLADDEYLGRIAARHSVRIKNRISTGEARPSSDEEDSARYGAVGGRQPFVVTGPHLKSREGLLNTGNDDDSEMGDVDSPTSPLSFDAKEEEAGLQRATSVKLSQGHARHISAGSAKLLELSPRNSVDAKRRSFEPRS